MDQNINEISTKLLNHLKDAGFREGVVIKYTNHFAIELSINFGHNLKSIHETIGMFFFHSAIENSKHVDEPSEQVVDYEYQIHILYKIKFEDLDIMNNHVTFYEEVKIGKGYERDRVIFDFCNFKKGLIISDSLDLTYFRIQKCEVYDLTISLNQINSGEISKSKIINRVSLGFQILVNSINIFNCEFLNRVRLNFGELNDKSRLKIYNSKFHQFIDISNEYSIHFLDRTILRAIDWSFQTIKPKGFCQSVFGKVIVDNHFNNSTYNDLNHQLHTYQRLRDFYADKNMHYETNQFQRLINHIYLAEKHFSKRDRFVLFWARISNDFGTNFVRGVFFTLSAALLFYLGMNFSLYYSNQITVDFSNKGIVAFLAHFLDFLNVAKWKIDFFELGQSNTINIFLYLGRVFIGFGIYQTITAFRKVSRM
jgi:hypothetical protein